MHLFFLSSEPVSGTYLSQETLYQIECCRGLLLAGLQGWPLKFDQHNVIATDVSPFPASPPGSCPPVQSELCDRGAKQVLHTRAEGELMFCLQLH